MSFDVHLLRYARCSNKNMFNRQLDRPTARLTSEGQTDSRQKDCQTDRETDIQPNWKTARQTDRFTDGQSNRQPDRETDR